MANKRQTQVIDIQSSAGITVNQSDEHQRNWDEPRWDKLAHTAGNNIDRTRRHLNFEIAKGGVVQPIDTSKSIPQRMKESLMERGIKDPNEGRKVKNIRTMINFIFGGSRERMRELAFGNQKVDFDSEKPDNSHILRCKEIELWAKDIYDFVCRKYGEQNIVGFYVHCDEVNPHVHCSVLPITSDNKFSWKYWFGNTMEEGIVKLDELHTSLAEVNAKWGLERGDDIHKTGAKHVSIEEYRRTAMAMERQIDESKTELQKIYDEINVCKKKIKSFETMIANLSAQKEGLEEQISTIREQLKASPDASNEELLTKLAQLNSILKETTDKLEMRLKSLEEVKAQLQEARNEKNRLTQLNRTLKSHSVETLNAMEAKTRSEMSHIGMSILSKGFSELLPTLNINQMSRLEGSFDELFDADMLNTFAEKTNEVITCATMLFYGFIDKATTYCESHGGGGSSSGANFKRDDDDDDWKWRRRCLAHAAKMMGSKSRGRRR